MLRSRSAIFNSGVRFHNNLAATEPAVVKMRWPRTLAGFLAIIVFASFGAMTGAAVRAALPSEASRQRYASVRWLQNEVGQVDGEAEHKLLADLAAARESFADHDEPVRFAQDLAAAFRRYGLDLDKVDPNLAGQRLGNRESTAQIASEIDNWSLMRRIRLERLDCRTLAQVARAMDLDPWRNAVRDQIDRREADALSVLRRCASDPGALDQQPVQSLLLLAVLLGDVGERVGAESVLSVADRRFPDDYWVWHVRGRFYRSESPYADPAKAVEGYATAALLRPKSAIAHSLLGAELQLQQNFNGAIGEYREAIRLKPDFAVARLQLGYVLWKQGKTVEAIAECREAIRIQPNFADAHGKLGGLLAMQAKAGEAIVALRRAIDLKPSLAEAHYNLGAIFLGQGKTDEAIGELREAIRLQPDDASAHYNLGLALHSRKLPDEEIAEYRRAIRIEPDHVNAHLSLAVELDNEGKLDEAINEYRSVLRLKPDDGEAHRILGRALARAGKANEAIAPLREAIRLKPNPAEAYRDLGHVLRQNGKIDEAIAVGSARRSV